MTGRPDLTMSQAEIVAFLATQERTVVLAVDVDGTSTGVVGRLVPGGFAVSPDAPLVDLLATDDRACCVVEHFPTYQGIQGVMLHGHAQPTDEPGRYDLAVVHVVSFDFGKLSP